MYSTVYLWVRAVVVFGLPAAVAAIAGVLLIRGDRVIIGGALFAARVAGLALTYPLTPTARAVLTVVLYRYAESGTGYGASPPSCSSTVCAAPRASSAAWPSGIEGDRIRRLRRRVLGDVDEPPSDTNQGT